MYKIDRKVLIASLVIITVLSITILLNTRLNTESTSPSETPTYREPHVLIYDSLAREYPNKTLTDLLIKIFIRHGYKVDLYIGENATLDPLFNLDNYDIIIFRAHGAHNSNPMVPKPLGSYIYTGIYIDEAIKIYGKDYINELKSSNMIVLGVIPPPGVELTNELIDRLPKYVVVSPLFFNKYVGELHRSIIVFTGCYGFDDDILAKIFIRKGARAYISFKGNVTWSHGDNVLEALMRKYLETHDIMEAYHSLDTSLAIDPITGAELKILLNE